MNEQTLQRRFGATPFTRKKLKKQRTAKLLFGLMTLLILLPLFAILTTLVIRALPSLSWTFLTEVPRKGMKSGGIWPALVGTVYLVVCSLVVRTPIGVLAGIYLNEFAKDNWFTRIVNLAVVNLAGVPSIVYGLFGVGAFVLFAGFGRSIIASSLTLAVMGLPVVITATKEALASVPMEFREACWNLGASKWQTVRTIVLPNSISGMLTGVILEVCRSAGECAPIMLTGVIFYKAVSPGTLFPYSLNEQCMALSYHLHITSTQFAGISESMLYATAVTLIGFILIFNSVAIGFRIYLRLRKKW